MDISPATRGHALVVPRNHVVNVLDADPGRLRRGRGLPPSGSLNGRSISSARRREPAHFGGGVAWQTVFHLHMHVIPRYVDDPPEAAVGAVAEGSRARSARPPSCCGERPAEVRLERDGGLAVVTFDSPPLNLMDRPLLDGLLAAVDRAGVEPARRGPVPR